jgi:hypothetical protein
MSNPNEHKTTINITRGNVTDLPLDIQVLQPDPNEHGSPSERKLIRLASDVSHLDKAPDLVFTVYPFNRHMRATHNDWTINIDNVNAEVYSVQLVYQSQLFIRAFYVLTNHPHFAEETEAEQVTSFACGLFWSAWRRLEFDRVATLETTNG